MNYLVLLCCDCGDSISASFPVAQEELTKGLNTEGWILSLVSPPGEPDTRWAVLCKDCAPKHYPPEVLAKAREEIGSKTPDPPGAATRVRHLYSDALSVIANHPGGGDEVSEWMKAKAQEALSKTAAAEHGDIYKQVEP